VPPPKASEDAYRTVQRYELLLLEAGRRLWSRMRPADFDGSWSRIAPRLVAFTAGAQLAAAEAGVEYVPTVLGEQDIDVEPLAQVVPLAFSGRASDGRSLEGLLRGGLVHAKTAVSHGLDGGDALLNGRKWLEQTLQSAVADAFRDASQASIAVRPRVGYVRMVNPPCCSRCAVLAGRVYRFHQAFPRHPQCDCLHIPTTVANADSFLTDPTALAERGLIKDLTKTQRDRIGDGADLPKVLNESRDRWRVRMAADRREQGPVDRAGRRRGENWAGWGSNSNPPPPGTTIHGLMAKLTADVERHRVAAAMRAAGIAE
jgi:hypothetical protein